MNRVRVHAEKFCSVGLNPGVATPKTSFLTRRNASRNGILSHIADAV